MPPHTIIAVTMLSSENVDAYQSWREKSPRWNCVRMELRTPFSKFVIQYQTCTATTTGIDQTSTSPEVSSTRTHGLRRSRSIDSEVPSTIVKATFATVKMTLLRSVCQKTWSCSTDEKFFSPT